MVLGAGETATRFGDGTRVSVWFDEDVTHDQYPALEKVPSDVDVCVVGAGIAGLSVAYNCAHHGLRVLVVDKGEIGSGETSRTTAHCFSWLDDWYTRIEHIHGVKGASLAAESHQEAIDFIERVCKYEDIECDMHRLDGWLLQKVDAMPQFCHDSTSRGKGAAAMIQEFGAAQRAGCHDVELLHLAPIPGVDTGDTVRFPMQAAFHPVKYINGLARAATSRGAQIYTNTRVVDFDHIDNNRAVIKTANGLTIYARHLVLATNTPINNKLSVHMKLKNVLSYAIAAEIPKNAYVDGLFWDSETDPAYHYVRFLKTANVNEPDFIIVGGEDHPIGIPQHCGPEIFRRLHNWAHQLWPAIGPIRYAWSGQIIEPVDGLAFIGRNPGDYDNVYIATGDSGNGITHGTIAGMLICDLIVGRSNEWSQLYDPRRQSLRMMGEMLKHDVEIGLQYKDYITAGDVDDIEDLERGCGAIIRRGLRKYAVYKDDKGMVYEHSAVCPHLGGVVRWNDNDKTFDCPAHGSRFDRFGCVLHGPALNDLQRLDKYLTSGPSLQK